MTHARGRDDLSSEKALLEAARARDQAAIAELYRRYRNYSVAVAMKIGVGTCDIEDIVNEAWARILDKFAAGAGPHSNFAAYLAQTVRRVATSDWRSTNRVLLTDSLEGLLLTVPSGPPDDDEDCLHDAYAALATLPLAQRQLLQASFRDGHDAAEYASLCKTTPNVIAARKTRARKALRRAYLAAEHWDRRDVRGAG